SGLFAENFFPDNPISHLKKNHAEIWAKAGKILAVKEIVAQNQLRGTFILEGENADISVYFTLAPEDPALIQQLIVRSIPKR
ncbi:MAG: serine hydrolase, partial [Acidobacteria bacterium]|nr:serine hydrolase [Acidobacteriota bacterium]